MDIPKFITALIFATLTACTDPPPPAVMVETVEEAVDDHPDVDCHPGLPEFWVKFRAAVLKEDMNALADLTEFPFIVHRYDGKRKLLSREEFIQHFPQFLNIRSDNVHSGRLTMKEEIRMRPTRSSQSCGEHAGQLNIEHWMFVGYQEGWHFIRADTHEFPASMKDIPIQPHPTPKPYPTLKD